MKKSEEDILLLEDQNSKSVKVRPRDILQVCVQAEGDVSKCDCFKIETEGLSVSRRFVSAHTGRSFIHITLMLSARAR